MPKNKGYAGKRPGDVGYKYGYKVPNDHHGKGSQGGKKYK